VRYRRLREMFFTPEFLPVITRWKDEEPQQTVCSSSCTTETERTMWSEELNWIYESLSADEEVIVPLRKLWTERYDLAEQISFEEFARVVLRDDRFEEVYTLEHDPQLESLGYFTGPRIKLRSRHITEQCVLRFVQKHNERIVQVLLRALQILGSDHRGRSDRNLSEAVEMLEELRPALKGWVHLDTNDPDDRTPP
jgi:hypothetical protein